MKWLPGGAAVVAAACLAIGGGCGKKGGDAGAPAPRAPAPVAAPAPAAPGPAVAQPGPAGPAPERAIRDEEVRRHWRAVEILVRDKAPGGSERTVKVPIGGEAAVPGTPITLRVLGFVPDFAMTADSITTKSLSDVNPAAKIQVLQDGKELFKGWAFRDFPDMHSFEDPRYTIAISRAVAAGK